MYKLTAWFLDLALIDNNDEIYYSQYIELINSHISSLKLTQDVEVDIDNSSDSEYFDKTLIRHHFSTEDIRNNDEALLEFSIKFKYKYNEDVIIQCDLIQEVRHLMFFMQFDHASNLNIFDISKDIYDDIKSCFESSSYFKSIEHLSGIESFYSCLLLPSESNENNYFTCQETHNLSEYDKSFHYSPFDFSDEYDAYNKLIKSLSVELDFLFYLRYANLDTNVDWINLTEKLNALLHKKTSKYNLVDRFLVRPRKIEDIFSDFVLFETYYFSQYQYFQRVYKDDFNNSHSKTFLNDDILDEIANNTNLPFKEMKELIVFYNNQVSKSIEVTTLFSAALIGACLGAIITITFS